MTQPFNLMKTSGRKPIKDRGIKWEENYHGKSAPLKKRFDHDLGPGAYYRWTGHDFTTNADYYVVVGPSVHGKEGKMFFSGVKRVPPQKAGDPDTKVYSPYGEYFPTIRAALSYASRKWGIRMPRNQVNYTKDMLANIKVPEHVKA